MKKEKYKSGSWKKAFRVFMKDIEGAKVSGNLTKALEGMIQKIVNNERLMKQQEILKELKDLKKEDMN